VGSVDGNSAVAIFQLGEHVALCAPESGWQRVPWRADITSHRHQFAAPFVAAAAALLLSRAGRRSFPLDGAAAKDILIASATRGRVKFTGMVPEF